MVFQKRRSSDSETEMILSTEFYQHKAIMQSIEAPFKGLENQSFSQGLTSVQLSAFLLEKLAWSNDALREDDLPELKKYIEEEKVKIKEDGLEVTDEAAKTRLAYAKIAWILKKIEKNKPTKTKYQV